MVLSSASCRSNGQPSVSDRNLKASYSPKTGRLERLTLDRDGDGRVDARAEMDGVQFKSVELDRNADGRPDRWEYYAPGPVSRQPTLAQSVLVRAEEANGPTGAITRREFYVNGAIDRVEEDTDGDGKVDKWERYEHGALVLIELDSSGRGVPDRRLVYGPDGGAPRVEVARAGDGKFEPVTTGKKNGG